MSNLVWQSLNPNIKAEGVFIGYVDRENEENSNNYLKWMLTSGVLKKGNQPFGEFTPKTLLGLIQSQFENKGTGSKNFENKDVTNIIYYLESYLNNVILVKEAALDRIFGGNLAGAGIKYLQDFWRDSGVTNAQNLSAGIQNMVNQMKGTELDMLIRRSGDAVIKSLIKMLEGDNNKKGLINDYITVKIEIPTPDINVRSLSLTEQKKVKISGLKAQISQEILQNVINNIENISQSEMLNVILKELQQRKDIGENTIVFLDITSGKQHYQTTLNNEALKKIIQTEDTLTKSPIDLLKAYSESTGRKFNEKKFSTKDINSNMSFKYQIVYLLKYLYEYCNDGNKPSKNELQFFLKVADNFSMTHKPGESVNRNAPNVSARQGLLGELADSMRIEQVNRANDGVIIQALNTGSLQSSTKGFFNQDTVLKVSKGKDSVIFGIQAKNPFDLDREKYDTYQETYNFKNLSKKENKISTGKIFSTWLNFNEEYTDYLFQLALNVGGAADSQSLIDRVNTSLYYYALDFLRVNASTIKAESLMDAMGGNRIDPKLFKESDVLFYSVGNILVPVRILIQGILEYLKSEKTESTLYLEFVPAPFTNYIDPEDERKTSPERIDQKNIDQNLMKASIRTRVSIPLPKI